MSYETLTFTIDDDIARITLNRPAVLNSLNSTMVEELRAVVASLVGDKARVLLLTGSGRGFCAGADISRPEGMTDAEDLAARGERVSQSMAGSFNPLMRELHDLPIPKIAAVNGPAAGGGASLALAADVVVAARSAYFMQVFAPRLGIAPDLGSTWHLPRLVGLARARGLALLGDRLDAATAAAWGLIWQCVDDDALMPISNALAARLRDGPTAALAETSRLMDVALGHDFATQLDLEREVQKRLSATLDHSEGIAAFNAKRPPVFYRRRSDKTGENNA